MYKHFIFQVTLINSLFCCTLSHVTLISHLAFHLSQRWNYILRSCDRLSYRLDCNEPYDTIGSLQAQQFCLIFELSFQMI